MPPRAKSKEFPAPPAAAHRKNKSRDDQALDLGKLNGHLGYFLRRLQIEVFKDIIGALTAYNIRPGQYSVLTLIEHNPGRSQADIGKALSIERAALAKMLHELEDRNWVQRLPAANDARSHSLFLTADGKNSLLRIDALADEHEQRIARLVGKKRWHELMRLLRDFG
jgi:DNA-binding MarR family transcriptional regulator